MAYTGFTMDAAALPHFPKLTELPVSLPADGAISIVLVQGVPTFRASAAVLSRVEQLTQKEQGSGLSQTEAAELTRYEEVDDYLSHLNRVVRNLHS